MAALNWQASNDTPLILINPSFAEGVLNELEPQFIAFEIRILRPDGQQIFYTYEYNYGSGEVLGNVIIISQFLQANLGDQPPEILSINVQAVDLSQILPNPGALPGTMPE